MGAADVYQRDENTGDYRVVSFFDSEANNEDYIATLRPQYVSTALRINELMPVNHTTLVDSDGDYSDWIELYNGSGETIDLAGYAISDDDTNHEKMGLSTDIDADGRISGVVCFRERPVGS